MFTTIALIGVSLTPGPDYELLPDMPVVSFSLIEANDQVPVLVSTTDLVACSVVRVSKGNRRFFPAVFRFFNFCR